MNSGSIKPTTIMKTSNVMDRFSLLLKNKAKITAMLLLSAVTLAGFTSCDNDDDEPIVDTINQQDRDFAIAVSQGINGQLALGNLAKTKGLDDSVLEYANMIVEDHAAAKSELEGIVSNKEIDISSESSAALKAEFDALEKLEGKAFDKAFINSQIDVNNNLESALKNQSDNGENFLLKSYADKTSDVIQKHGRNALAVKAELALEDL
jgi:predicted outer membrane protein